MMAYPSTIRVAILGGNLGSAALLRGLLRHPHITVDLYEWQPTFKLESHAVIITPAAEDILLKIDPTLVSCLDRAGAVHTSTQIKVSAGAHAGQLIWSDNSQQQQQQQQQQQRMVDPQNLLTELVRDVPPHTLHFNSRVASITDLSSSSPSNNNNNNDENGVLLSFSDGSQQVYDIIIGAESRCTTSRRYVLGRIGYHDARRHGCWELPVRVPYERALQALGPDLLTGNSNNNDNNLLPCQTSYVGNGTYLQHDFMGEGKDVIITAMADLFPDEGGGPWAKLLTPEEFSAAFAGNQLPVCRDMVNLILSLYTVQVAGICAMDHQTPPTYVTKNFALMADAAHSLLTLQGGNVLVALEEALVLSMLLGKATSREAIPAALKAYDEVCRPRAERAVFHTKQFKLTTAGRDAEIGLDPLRMAPRLQEHWEFMKETNIEAQLATAAQLMDLYNVTGRTSRHKRRL
ncbi:FAD/NAD(P)-binding domain-containing protein [Poronia punctata]|nr:FAD/NAD(P)-binding domain-containing protein [Poronia punctata]